ncbi:flagellar biosynthesis anti-sigma factor FlgM [Tepidimonas alkaliphilus]|uniref:Negative regulator of flagellin synthesis n=1 Tax=Tepidimonas alkaliphilus TaxID=2588942 RepID=A0A554WB18_9BURK|nr:flagellar biosynthesis anti-sigma factor FlgM [Tepidimonas alkaliphilus]TSE20778.1 flagellar biosynthesis anti-sigma factor FlgM [Tepidimonas alkaliphilus]
MKVQTSPDVTLGAPAAAVPKRPETRAQSAAPSVAPAASSSVKLSPVTQEMTNGVARSGTDVFDAAKVEAMRTAIQNGSFTVNPEAIADRMLASAREMLGVASGATARSRG